MIMSSVDQDLNQGVPDIKYLRKLRKSQKKAKNLLEKEIQGSVKTKRKVINFLKKAESVSKTKEMSKAKSRSKAKKVNYTKPFSVFETETMEDDDAIVNLASDESEADDSQNISPSRSQAQGAPSSSSSLKPSLPQELLIDNSDDSVEVIDSESDDMSMQTDEAVHPSMRKFDNGIYYRKLDSDSVLVSVNQHQFLYFSGKCAVKVLKGSIEIYGYQMTPINDKVNAFSPKGHSSLLCINAINMQSEFDKEEIPEKWSSFLTREELEDLTGAVFVMQAFDNEWAEGLRNFSPIGETLVGPSITGIGPSKLPKMKSFMEKLGFQFLPENMWRKNRLFNTSPAWEEVFQGLTLGSSPSSTKISIFGGKGVGKSTFTRWMTNKFLSIGSKTVLYIDLDPGQTEFTPPGVISACICEEPLLGPNFTHLKQPIRSIFVGGISVADYPITYLKAVVQLFEFCSEEEYLASIPWVINTMGFCQGLGVHLAVGAIKIFQPTAVIQLHIANDKRSYPFDLNISNVMRSKPYFLEKNLPERYTTISEEYNFIKIQSVCNQEFNSNINPWGASPKNLRENVIISYFSEIIGSTSDFRFTSVIPFNISLNEIAIGTMSSDLTYEGAIRVLVGNLVVLCEFSSDCIEESQLNIQNAASSNSSQQRGYIKKAELYEHNCYGYAVIRAYDKITETLHLISPVDEETLKTKVNAIIAAGNIGLPIQFYIGNTTDPSSVPNEVPYVMDMRDGKSRLHTTSKKYFAPKKVTHSVLKNSLL